MRRIKRSSVALVVGLTLLTACGGDTATTTTEPEAGPTTTTVAAVVTTAPATVTTRSDAGVTLDAPAEVEGGSVFEVTWTGPQNESDFITIVAAGAPVGSYLDWKYASSDNPMPLVAPVEAGEHEIRYVDGATNETVHYITIMVTQFEATVEAPAEVDAGATFEVTWTGPDGPSDYITIVPVGAAEGFYLDWKYLSSGNPLQLTAPDEPGEYEVRYYSDRGAMTLATAPIAVR
jgi:Ca-activated chloride channel family protein